MTTKPDTRTPLEIVRDALESERDAARKESSEWNSSYYAGMANGLQVAIDAINKQLGKEAF